MDGRRKLAIAVIAVAALIALVTAVQLVGREARWLDVGTLVASSFAVGAAARSLASRRRASRSDADS